MLKLWKKAAAPGHEDLFIRHYGQLYAWAVRLTDQDRQKAEVASVIAGAFGLRALARELVGKIPFGGGLIPKAAIAYAGTWVVGQSLDRLYGFGTTYDRGEQKAAYKEGLAMGKKVAKSLLAGLKGKTA